MATPLPTPVQRVGTAQSHAAATTSMSMSKDAIPSEPVPTSPAGHQRFVLTDVVAARYLEHDPNTTVLLRRQKIQGYEIYLVEQWACSRSHPTFLITTYTGNPADSVLASIISVPADEAEWSPQMRLYFRSLTDYHARRKETPYGTLMITNLSGFPSSLTVIPIPGGDLKKYRDIFIVNENLKRLGCSGRLGIKLEAPNGATEAKFHQLYRTSEKIPLSGSVIELVKLCQVALVLFGKLEPEYADGLLCDVTEKAVNDWWVEFGAEYYTVEPHDGILGPTTVAALLGMLMGARNRLSACNAPVTKDVFDIESTKRGLAHFQKSQHIPRTRRLDRQTLDKLRRATAKAASKEGWAVPRAFKSTVAELGGKGGEMVMGMVGAGQKDGIAEIETVDIDQFVELVRGDHAKWLWHGKPRKSTVTDMFNRLPGDERPGSADGQDVEINKQQPRTESSVDQQKLTKRDTGIESLFSPDGVEKDKDRDPFSKRATLKARLDPGSGLRHIKDAVGLRTHASKLSREEHLPHGLHRSKSDLRRHSHQESVGGTLSRIDTADDAATEHLYNSEEPAFTKVLTETPRGSASTLALPAEGARPRSEVHSEPSGLRTSVVDSEASANPQTVESSIAGSTYHGIDLNEKLPLSEAHRVPPLLRRTLSDPQLHLLCQPRNDDWWPRHLSFSIAEENVFKWTSIAPTDLDEEAIAVDETTIALSEQHIRQTLNAETLKQLYHHISLLSTCDTKWVSTRLANLHSLEDAADVDIETLDSIYYPRLDTYHALREETHAVITNNRTQLTVSLRELGNIGDKLEYEISALRSKAEDVEDALSEFERQVEGVESRAAELEKVLGRREGWWGWVVRNLTGIERRT